ncbi:MAG: hypothetical protein OEV42_20310 [Deltaproteobacteria bacterium]|nr:hypothetical protein [Deltaproteobacteria bacterium]
MDTVHVNKTDFTRILDTAETLIDEVEHALEEDEIVSKRLEDVKSGRVTGKTEKELDDYLKSRGVELD